MQKSNRWCFEQAGARRLAWFAGLVVGLGVSFPVQAAEPAPRAALRLHVPSPDWRDQIIYFAVTDRFADGDPRNNDQGAGEYKPGERSRYQGGDLLGLTQHLSYIQGLGATALWITPPVANQWLDPAGNYSGYHGYWAEHFMKVDKHLGSLEDYRLLSDALHRRGMYLVQDIVVNHTGNFFTYRDRWQRTDPVAGWEGHDTSPPVPRPSQPPFDRNDPRDAAQRTEATYHWTPDVTDYRQREQELNYQMSGLDDLNTESPAVRRALRQSYGYWVREVGVDAFRVDTAFYVPPDYFADFLFARDPAAPGIHQVARSTGRKGFFSFGEGFGIDRPGQDEQSRKIESYMRGPGQPPGKRLLDGMLNFPLYGALGDAFARGRPPAELGARIEAMLKLHARPHTMLSFIDNHDVDRFLAGGNTAGLEQALLALMTLPGIPVIYYGTEQGFTEQRAAMFAAGWGSGGRDRFDTTAPLYRRIAELAALRRANRLFSRGLPTVLTGQRAGPGALVWRTTHAGQQALVAFNTADGETLAAQVSTGLAPGTRLEGLYGLHGMPAALTVGPRGRVNLSLPPRAGQVWRVQAAGYRPVARGAAAPALDPLGAASFGTDFEVRGRAQPGQRVQLVVNGDLARAAAVTAGDDGRFGATIDTARMTDPDVVHEVVAWTGAAASERREFKLVREWALLADVPDPAGDDRGPDGAAGAYTYPTDPGWAGRQMDLRRVQIYAAGGALRIDIATPLLSQGWNPPNGFDRVLFTVFVELPGAEGGATVMPLQNAHLPDGMRWHLRLRVGGWSNALFGAAGASATAEGTSVSPAATLRVDRNAHSVSLVLPAAALPVGRDGRDGLKGARIYVTTWDYDGGYRAIGPVAGGYSMGGGAPDAPKVMDAAGPVVLP